ncbi:GNAT family N-acetyltransferase [Verminephrobacter aporrectodeae subsp. tuberculatae]|uniref:GNAT family N-acetyltransferase n=1 Tax=Verminephrobacter aporrectodeae TaxID=1110389 RepID=UPI0022449A89|nr:GNAT family N-acetyltransferase [Verminephrobacter aporrectodeae]MCW8197159.1 GNAT family N-acetyltransferase [Verminephrobacter aporrectodeae subsp. tuberculatae]
MQVIPCTEAQLDIIAELFNDYRIFYEQASDLPASRAFIEKNLKQQRSKIFLLLDDNGTPTGFSQLYPAVCSLMLRTYYYLSDLYVVKSARRNGHARYLMNYITKHFTRDGAQRLTLDTATTNKIAQNLYESLGYEHEEVYITYHQRLDTPSEVPTST